MLRQLLEKIVDVIFPPSDHELRLRRMSPEIFIQHYHPLRINGLIACAPYHNQAIQAAVAACKFEHNKHAALLLAALIKRWLETHPSEGETILLPTPLSNARERERGFNQVTRVLELIPPSSNVRLVTTWLAREVDTIRQTSLGRTERLTNMKEAFSPTRALKETTWTGISRIIICDDVLTTGATLHAARATLAKEVPASVKIECVAWAH